MSESEFDQTLRSVDADEPPELGQLISLHHYRRNIETLYIGSMEEDGEDFEVENGTLAIVVGFKVRSHHIGESCTAVVAVGGRIGWIFNDEWEPVHE